MKKFMALCLTIIMVFSMFTVAVSAATITVPAYTAFDQSFAGISEAPADFTLAGNYSIQETYIKGTKGGFSMLYNNEVVTGGADYKYTVNFSLSNAPVYIHLGAATPADAIADKVADTGYTLRARTGIGDVYSYAAYDLYKNGVLVSEEYNYNSYGYQNLHTVAIEVTGESIILTGPFAGSPVTIADAEPITSGYAGVFVGENNLNKSGLGSMKLEAEAFSYDVNTSGAATGGYVELDGAGAFDQSFAGISEAPNGWTLSGNFTYENDSLKAVNPSGNVTAFKTDAFDTNGAEYTVVTNIASSNRASYIHIGAQTEADAKLSGVANTGYTIAISNYSGSDYVNGSYKLYKNSTLLTNEKWYGGYDYQKLKDVKLTVSPTGITFAGSATVTFEDAEPITSGYIGVVSNQNNVTWGGKLSKVSLSYKSTKANFLLDKTFTAADTLDSLASDGFTPSGTGVNANGIYMTEGRASVGFATKFGGSYTIETYCDGNYNNPETITFNKTDDGDSYVLRTEGNSYSLTRNFGGEATTLVSETFADKAQCPYYTFARKHKIVITANEDGTKDIDVYLGTKQIIDITDEEPITAAGTVSVLTGYNKPSNIHNLKVYPGATAPVIAGEFLVNGTTAADKGDTVFTFPVMMLAQNADVIAALYEDGKMTDIKMVDFDTLNSEGYAQLFNTTASKANDVNVKVFIWDSLAGMTPVTNAFALNK